jgi:hypothetical protein
VLGDLTSPPSRPVGQGRAGGGGNSSMVSRARARAHMRKRLWGAGRALGCDLRILEVPFGIALESVGNLTKQFLS